MPRFRPGSPALEAREVPPLKPACTATSLTRPGTPTATPAQLFPAENVGGNNVHVTRGVLDLGTCHVTRDIAPRLASCDCLVGVDPNGGRLAGSWPIAVGAEDRDPATNNGVSVGNNAGHSQVAGDVTFRGGAGTAWGAGARVTGGCRPWPSAGRPV